MIEKQMISGQTRLIGLFATPIRHSLSPFIQNTALNLAEIDARYLAFDIKESDFPAAIASIKALDMLGANLSMPYKREACDYMDELSPAAKLIGAINTIVHRNDKLIGHNTDGIGLIQSLAAEGFNVADKTITILGAGGAATAIATQMALDGAKEIHVFNRKSPTFSQFNEKMQQIKKHCDCSMQLYELADEVKLAEALSKSQLCINATSIGMLEAISPLTDHSILTKETIVVDIIYHPEETKFLQMAKAQGCQTYNGLGMLLYQAAAAFELWTGKSMPVTKIYPLLQEQIRKQKMEETK